MSGVTGRNLAIAVIAVNWLLIGGAVVIMRFATITDIHDYIKNTTEALESFFNTKGTNGFVKNNITSNGNTEPEGVFRQWVIEIAGPLNPGGILFHTMLNIILTVAVIKSDLRKLTFWIYISLISFFVSVYLYVQMNTADDNEDILLIWIEFCRIAFMGVSLLAIYYFRDEVAISEEISDEEKFGKLSCTKA